MKRIIELILCVALSCYCICRSNNDYYIEKDYGDIIDIYEAPKAPNNFWNYIDSLSDRVYSTLLDKYDCRQYYTFYIRFLSNADMIDTSTISVFPIYKCGNNIPCDSYIWNEFIINIKDAMKKWKLKHFNRVRTYPDIKDTLVADSIEKACKIPPNATTVLNSIVLKLSYGYELPFFYKNNTILSGIKEEE